MDYEYRDFNQYEWHEIPTNRVIRRGSRSRRDQDSRWEVNVRAIILVIVLTIALSLVSVFSASQLSAMLGSKSGSSGIISLFGKPIPEKARSTPRNEWSKGSMPYIYQTDDEWANAPYADDTVAASACGPTCMTMAYIYLTGKTDYDPASMANFSEKNGFVDSGMTSWKFMSEGAGMLGLDSEELPADRTRILHAIRSGRPVIVSVDKGDFTDTGHFIILCGINDEGQIEIRDPNSPERSKQYWDLSRIMSQARNYWAMYSD